MVERQVVWVGWSMMMTSAANLSPAAVNDANDSGRMRAVMITGRNVPANVSTAEKPLKTRTGRMMIPGVHRNADRYLNA
jgi:hypothetical protein